VTPPEEAAGIGAWSPDGRHIYYLSDRDGQVCLWARSIDESSIGGPDVRLANEKPDHPADVQGA
jgi:hypothetical protein